jgi:hypothetical protein
LWRIELLLGKVLEANNETRAVAMQRLGEDVPAATLKYAIGEKECFLRGPGGDVLKKRSSVTSLVDS